MGPDGVPKATGSSRSGAVDGVIWLSVHTSLTTPPGWPSGIRAVGVAGQNHASLVLGSNGVVYGIGAAGGGAYDTEDYATSFRPITGLPAGVTAESLAAGPYSTLIIGSDGVPYAAGDTSSGQLGRLVGVNGTQTLTPVEGLPEGVRAVQMDGGLDYLLVLGSDGVVYGAGQGVCGAKTPAGGTGLVPIAAPENGVHVAQVAAGPSFIIELGTDGELYGCGRNSDGQLATPWVGYTTANIDPLDELPTGVRAVSVDAGYETGGPQSVVLGSDGTVYIAGSLSYIDPSEPSGRTLTWRALPRPAGAGRFVEAVSGMNDVLMRDQHGGIWGVGSNDGNDGPTGQLGGTAERYGPTPHPFAGQALISVKAPSLTGQPRVGVTLHASIGSFDLVPTKYTYRWFRDGHAVGGATASSYPLRSLDRGRRLSFSVTASAPGMTSATATSAPTVPVAPGAALRWTASLPRITGTAKVNQTLKVVGATKTGWSPDASSISYEWLRGSTVIARTATYRTKAADKGHTVRVRVSGHLSGYASGAVLTLAIKVG